MPNALTYYPSEKYIRKNWAPEEFGRSDLESIARAEKLARSRGILPPALAAQFMPLALVENTPSHGVIDGAFGYPPNARRNAMLKAMGLGYTSGHTPDERARMAAAVLAEKAALYGNDKAIERYNGRGRAYEEESDEWGNADASNHVRKVQEMTRMLQHPKNALLRQTYEQMLRGQ
jgi:hypothetical protein